MIVYRLGKTRFSGDLSGKGAELCGGRWNSRGTAMIYTCSSRALCTTEIAVHTPLGNIPVDYALTTLEIPDRIVPFEADRTKLPADWRAFPHPNSTQLIGDKFVKENKHLILKVPSAVVQGDFNFLFNPHHKDIKYLKVVSTEPFSFDRRLFVR